MHVRCVVQMRRVFVQWARMVAAAKRGAEPRREQARVKPSSTLVAVQVRYTKWSGKQGTTEVLSAAPRSNAPRTTCAGGGGQQRQHSTLLSGGPVARRRTASSSLNMYGRAAKRAKPSAPAFEAKDEATRTSEEARVERRVLELAGLQPEHVQSWVAEMRQGPRGSPSLTVAVAAVGSSPPVDPRVSRRQRAQAQQCKKVGATGEVEMAGRRVPTVHVSLLGSDGDDKENSAPSNTTNNGGEGVEMREAGEAAGDADEASCVWALSVRSKSSSASGTASEGVSALGAYTELGMDAASMGGGGVVTRSARSEPTLGRTGTSARRTNKALRTLFLQRVAQRDAAKTRRQAAAAGAAAGLAR